MARGTGLRNKKLTIRLTDEEYEKLSREADQYNISISEHARHKLNSNDNQSMDILRYVCEVSTSWSRILSKYDIAQEDRGVIDQEVRSIWQRLK